jgi:hypothetical protein
MQLGAAGKTRRRALEAMGALAVAAVLSPGSRAQGGMHYEWVQQVDSRAEFDIEGGAFVLLEYDPASRKLRTLRSRIRIRFQITDAYLGTKWAPNLGFSVGSEDGTHELQVDFADLPINGQLAISIDRLANQSRQKTPIARMKAPKKFKRHDVHDIDLVVESDSAIALVMDGRAYSLPIDFKPHRLVVRPSGVKGWVEFVQPAVA